MDYKTQKRQWAERRRQILAMIRRKGPNSYNIVARAFKISRQRVQQIATDEGKRNGD